MRRELVSGLVAISVAGFGQTFEVASREADTASAARRDGVLWAAPRRAREFGPRANHVVERGVAEHADDRV